VVALKDLGVDPSAGELHEIFFSTPPKTKMEQFFRLLYYIQKGKSGEMPLTVTRPKITTLLLAAKVFKNRAFPDQISSVGLSMGPNDRPRFIVRFDQTEVRFPLNDGIGFAVWDHGKCQLALELVLYDRFGFELNESGKNLVVRNFEGVDLFGDFGARGLIDLDLNYAELERVEFLHGTDKGRVNSRVSEREMTTNPHSLLFRLVGRLIPDSSVQRIDW
jgi:hypothetical protein